LVSLDGVAPSRMVGVSASFNLLLHHKVQKFSSVAGSPGWSRKKGRKTVVVVVVVSVKKTGPTILVITLSDIIQFSLFLYCCNQK